MDNTSTLPELKHESFTPLEVLKTPELTIEDRRWLTDLGLEWPEDSDATMHALNDLVRAGSPHVSTSGSDPLSDPVIDARETFFSLLGRIQSGVNEFRTIHPTIMPLDTFIASQRKLSSLGIDNAGIVNSYPILLGFAPDTIQSKFDKLDSLGIDIARVVRTYPMILGFSSQSLQTRIDNLDALGVDSAKAINSEPSAIGFAPESVQAKMDNLTSLGLDATRVIKSHPKVLVFAPKTVEDKVNALNSHGIDAVKVINAYPTLLGVSTAKVLSKIEQFTVMGIDIQKASSMYPVILGLDPETVRLKKLNLEDLGLDANRILGTYPSVLGYTSELLKKKLTFLERSAKLLGWENDVTELVNSYPVILGFSLKKLQMMRRLAAQHFGQGSQEMAVNKVKSALITPLEQYLIAVTRSEDDDSLDMLKRARKIKLAGPERKKEARQLAQSGSLGRIGTMYLRYANK